MSRVYTVPAFPRLCERLRSDAASMRTMVHHALTQRIVHGYIAMKPAHGNALARRALRPGST